MGARPLPRFARPDRRRLMDDAAIVALLSGIEPSVGEIPHPPFMAAVPAAPVIESGADLAAIDAWVKARGGWTHRVPAHLAGPGSERAPLFFIVPKGHLHPRVGGAVVPPLVTGRASGGRPPGAPPLAGAPPAGVPVTGTAAGAVPVTGSASGSGAAGSVAAAPGAPGAGAADARSGLGSADVMAFVATSDMPAARAFYERALGLRVTGQSPIACVFDAHGTTLRVVAVEEPTIAPYTVLGWIVSDIAATIRELTARGVDFARFDGMEQDELGIWNAPGGTRRVVQGPRRQRPVPDAVRLAATGASSSLAGLGPATDLGLEVGRLALLLGRLVGRLVALLHLEDLRLVRCLDRSRRFIGHRCPPCLLPLRTWNRALDAGASIIRRRQLPPTLADAPSRRTSAMTADRKRPWRYCRAS